MRLCHRAGHIVSLLTISAVLGGCATTVTDPPSNFNSNPQVVAVYAVDSAFGSLPDVLIFSSDPADSGKISTNPPPSYGSYRVEFDQPVSGATVANGTDRGTSIGGAASFCSTSGSSPVQLVDVQGDGTRPAGPVTSSVCYDATSALGSHPHVLVVPGAGALRDPAAKPLTCNTFTPEGQNAGNKRDPFKPNHKYGIQVKSGVIQNNGGKTLSAPTGAGWTADTFQFTTSGLKILAAGFQDANTGFFVWLDKPEPGFEKDLAPIPATYQEPADSSPFLIILSEAVSPTAAVPTLTGQVSLVRADDGSDPAHSAVTRGNLIGDRRVIEVNTGDTFEPGQAYNVTVPASLTADSGDVLGTAKTYTFTATAGTADVLSTTPANGAQAQPQGTTPSVEFAAPVAVDATGTPTGTFTLTGPAGLVPLASVKADPKANNQVVTLTPTAELLPETTYTIATSGVKVGAHPKALAGQTFPPGQSQFTTRTFRMALLDDPARDAVVDAAGGATPVNLDRRTDVEPSHLKDGNLVVIFNDDAAGVSPASISVSELTGAANTATKIPGYAVTQPDATDATAYAVKLPATYQLKYGQKYEIRTLTTITNPTSGKALKAEGCTTGDCSDVKSFTTRKVGAAIAADPSPDKPTGFTVSFTDPMDPASINLTSEFKLFPRDATGALSTQSLPLSCKITDGPGSTGPGNPANPTVVTCTATGGLGNAPNAALASAVFLQTAPVKVLPAVSTDASAQFFGSVSGNIFGACP